jgi:TetR/AcrR family transcriptional repressor of mexJK operon
MADHDVAPRPSGAAVPGRPRGPGRPRDPTKRAAILEAGHRLFLEHGVAVVSMEAVAAAAGVSKMTLYSHFKDKERLFEEVVAAKSDGMIAEMARTQEAGGTLADSLAALGRAFLGLVCSPDIVAAERNLMTTLAGNRALAERFYAAGPARTEAAVALVLQAATARGELDVDDPAGAAVDLLALWQGDLSKRLSLGLQAPLSPEQIEVRSRTKTATFLRAYAPRRA